MGLPDNLESLSIEELQAMHDNMAAQVASSGASFEPASYPQRIAGGLATALSGGTFGLSDKLIEAASFDPQAREKLDFLKNQYAQSAGSGLTAATSIGGSLLTPVGQIGKAIGAPKAASAVLDYASKIPAGRFLAQRAVDFVPGAIMSGTAGYNNAPEGQELETAINDAIIGGGASMLLSPAGRALSNSKSTAEKMARAQEAKAFGLSSNDIAKSATISPSAAIEEGETLIQTQLSKILEDVDAKTAKSGDELFARVVSKKNQLGAKYDEIVATANEINGGKSIKFNAADKKSILDWIDSPAVPTGMKEELKGVASKAIENFNTSKNASLNPFAQLKTDRTSYNAAFKDINPDAATLLSKQMRKLFSAKLKASLSQVSGNKEVGAALARDLTELDKAYAPYAALRNSIAKIKGKDATSLSLEDALKSIGTTAGLGTFIKTGFEKGGIVGGLATTAVAAPALMFARTPGGALSTSRFVEGAGKVSGALGNLMTRGLNPLVANYAGSVGRSNKEFAKQKEIDAVLADIPDSDPAASKRDISFSQESLPPLIQAMISVESNKNPRAVSKAGAIGLMQLMPANAKKLGIDPLDPMQNIFGGMQILDEEIKRFKDPLLALAAYNAGSPQVNAAIKKAGSRDWDKVKKYLPAETRAYPAKIMAAMNKLETSTKG